MPKYNVEAAESVPGSQEYFTGTVTVKRIINDSITKDVEVWLVSFQNGARTKLHYHDSDQVLMGVEGKGAVGLQTKVTMGEEGIALVNFEEVQPLERGDFVCIPALTWHWHGARRGENFSHYQIKRPCKTVWLESPGPGH